MRSGARCVREMLAVVALLSVEDIYLRPRAPELMEEASKAHSRFFDRVRGPDQGPD